MTFVQVRQPATLGDASLPGGNSVFPKLDEQALSTDFSARHPGGPSPAQRTDVGLLTHRIGLTGRIDPGEADERNCFA
jgi:hypothetical protein